MSIIFEPTGFEPVTFDRLWAVAGREALRLGRSPRSVFEGIGLNLEPPVAPWQYYCTPKNVRTFASTGRDGVHYSLLNSWRTGPQLLDSPVVMTVPMNFANNNIIVGETLHEFLCLGCRVGYAGLESLASVGGDLSRVKAQGYSRSLSALQVEQLRRLSGAFSLYPFVNLERRMARLQAMYLEGLQLGEMELIPAVATRR